MRPLIIDAHHHFWDPTLRDYWWMTGEAEFLRRRFDPADLRPELQSAGVGATVLVQTCSSLEESISFLKTAATTDFVAGVVGWVDLTASDVSDTIASLKISQHGHKLVGIRHQVHDEVDPEWLLRADVQRGLQAVQEHGLVYDLLVRPRELGPALETTRRFGDLRFVIDHIAKPDIASGEIEQWQSLIRPFRTERHHVWCKLSGMATEARRNWIPADFKPYILEVLDIFGVNRCVFGSDWPVSLLAGRYGAVLNALKENIAHLSDADQSQVLSGSSIELYRLSGFPI